MLEAAVVGPTLAAREGLQAEFLRRHRRRPGIARGGAIGRRLRTAPGVGALVAVAFGAAVDDPSRFRSANAVGAHFGLTPKRQPSGDADVAGGISEAGHAVLTRGA